MSSRPVAEVRWAGAEPRLRLAYASRETHRRIRFGVRAIKDHAEEKVAMNLHVSWSFTPPPETDSWSFRVLEVVPVRHAPDLPRDYFERFADVAGTACSVNGVLAFVQSKGRSHVPPLAFVLDSVAVPCPALAVGLGAIWETSHKTDVDGSLTSHSLTCTLTSMEHGLLTINLAGDCHETPGSSDLFREAMTRHLEGVVVLPDVFDGLPIRGQIGVNETWHLRHMPSETPPIRQMLLQVDFETEVAAGSTNE